MSLFEKIKDKRYDLQEIKKEMGSGSGSSRTKDEIPLKDRVNKGTGSRTTRVGGQNSYDKRPFTKYELEQAKKANTTPAKLRAKFKGASFDGPPFARQTRKFDTPYTTQSGKKKISPSFFDKRQEFGVKDDGSIDPRGVRKRMGSRFFSARVKQYKDTLKQIDTDTKAGKDTKILQQKANKYKRFLEKGARGASGQKFLDKIVNRVTSDSVPGGGRKLKTIDTSSKPLVKRLKDYSDLTEPTVSSKAPPATGKKFKTFDGSPAKGLRKGTKARLPMKGGANLVDFDPNNLPKGTFDPKTGKGIDQGGFARMTDSKGKFIKMKDLEKVNRRKAAISVDSAKGIARADKGGFLTAKVYTGDKKQQAAYKKAVEAGKKKFYAKTDSKKILGVSNKTGDFDAQFKADKARLDIGGKISPMDGLTDAERKRKLKELQKQINIKNPTITSPLTGKQLPATKANLRKYGFLDGDFKKQNYKKTYTSSGSGSQKSFSTGQSRFKKLTSKLKMPKTQTLRKVGKYALGAYVLNQVLNPRGGGAPISPPKKEKLTGVKVKDFKFNLAGPGGDGYKPAGMIKK